MKPKNNKQNTPTADILAEAKAIRQAMKFGALSYKEAKAKAEPLLEIVNRNCEMIAKRHKRHFRKLRFTDL